ncbi:unnamed protein product [Adineta steineri]|uniref:Major facilitator superfamily (MFS) profile domain-containing protein n=1 Tax=Adineta steineri TaxID=433720 RepID=A0A814CGH4_9BILA|nr:unnamed protein product [Adineta steineri]CAF3972833.1 unnamed protein product [Adineta steineri]
MTNNPQTIDPTLLSKTLESPTTIDHTPSIVSIYDIRSTRRRLFILITLSFSGLILPFSDTVYLPALIEIEHDLHASTTLVDYTVSAYLIAAGVVGLLWGPLGDRYGRKIILLISFGFFVAFTIVCILARSIVVLLIFRALQGGAISASFVVGQSVIVDIYRSGNLGFAMGLFLVPLLVGPILGPFIGGALSNWLGWRSTFITLAILAVLSAILILVFVPETHHYFVMKQLRNPTNKCCSNKKKIDAIEVQEADSILKPRFMAPWRPFVFLFDITMAPHIIACNINYGCLFIILTLMSNRASEEPYKLTPFIVGVCYIPTGISSLVGSLLGGYVSDWSAKRFSRVMEGRLIFSLLGSLTCPIGLLICGWTFHFGVHIVVPILGIVIFCFGETFLFTSVCAFINVKKPAMAGALLALLNSVSFTFAGVGLIVTVPLVKLINYGPLFSILAGLNFLIIIIATGVVLYQIRKSRIVILTSNNLNKEPWTITDDATREKTLPIQRFSFSENT